MPDGLTPQSWCFGYKGTKPHLPENDFTMIWVIEPVVVVAIGKRRPAGGWRNSVPVFFGLNGLRQQESRSRPMPGLVARPGKVIASASAPSGVGVYQQAGPCRCSLPRMATKSHVVALSLARLIAMHGAVSPLGRSDFASMLAINSSRVAPP